MISGIALLCTHLYSNIYFCPWLTCSLYDRLIKFLWFLGDGRPHQLHQSSCVWACRRKANSLCQRWPHLQVSCTAVRVYECEKVKYVCMCVCVCECVLFSVNDAESLDQISTLKPDTKHNTKLAVALRKRQPPLACRVFLSNWLNMEIQSAVVAFPLHGYS